MLKQAKRKKIWIGNAIVLLLLALLFALLPLTGKGKQVTVSAANEGFTYEGSQPTVTTNNFGTQFSSSNAFKVKTDRVVWMDKMGMAGTFNANGCGLFDIIFTSEKDAWYESSSTAHYVKLALTYVDDETASVDVIVDGETIWQDGEIAVYWSYEESTQVESDRSIITLTKTDGANIESKYNQYGGWVLQGLVNTQVFLDETAGAKLDAVMAYFENGNGYLQFASGGGKLDFTFLGVVYGSQMIDANYEDADENFYEYESFGSLTQPVYGYTSGEEKLSLFSPKGVGEWYVSSYIKMPLNGFELDLRLAHGEKLWKTSITAFSRYHHDWYKGSYAVGFEITWDPMAAENERTTVEFLYYTSDTVDKSVTDGGAGFYPSSGFVENPRKLTVKMADSEFPWFEDLNFKIEKSRGSWSVTLNGKNIWEGVNSVDGRTISSYLDEASGYFSNNNAYLLMGCENLRPYDGAAKTNYTGGFAGILIKDWAVVEAAGAELAVSAEYAQQFDGLELTTAQAVEIVLSDLFTGGSGDFVYTATKGLVLYREEQDQTVFIFTADMAGTYHVTVTAFDGVTRVDKRFTFYFTGDPVFVS